MTEAQPRTLDQRRADTLAKLTAPAADVWVATAGMDATGHARSYLVPLSLAWIDDRIVLATGMGQCARVSGRGARVRASSHGGSASSRSVPGFRRSGC
jgi:hypothetical protein